MREHDLKSAQAAEGDSNEALKAAQAQIEAHRAELEAQRKALEDRDKQLAGLSVGLKQILFCTSAKLPNAGLHILFSWFEGAPLCGP